MKNLILWSGGYDSTAIVIQEGFKSDVPFDLCYCVLPNNTEQQERELKARRKILKTLCEKYPKSQFGQDVLFDYVCQVNAIANHNLLTQPYIWATTLAWNLNPAVYTNVITGYVRGDDFWHVRQEFEQVVTAGLKILHCRSSIPTFTYPFEWYDKKGIYHKVYDVDNLAQILYDIEVCEYSDCSTHDRCSPCEKHIAEFGYMINGNTNYTYM